MLKKRTVKYWPAPARLMCHLVRQIITEAYNQSSQQLPGSWQGVPKNCCLLCLVWQCEATSGRA